MVNRPLTASVLSIVLAMGICLPAPALASDMTQGGSAAENRASAQENGAIGNGLAAGSSSESELLSGDTNSGRLLANAAGTASGVQLLADGDAPSLPDGPLSGTCGEDATWTFDALTRTLTISGTGSVSDNSGWLENAPLIRKVVIEEGITEIGSRIFELGAFTSVSLPDTLTSLGDGAFSGCAALTSIELPNSVRTVGAQAFSGCASLKEATLSSSLTSLGARAFLDCASLTSVAELGAISEIKDSAFSGCLALESISIPASVTKIGSGAFRRCESAFADGLIFPAALSEIGSSAFQGCGEISSIEFTGSAPLISNSAFTQVTARAIFPEGNSTWGESARKNYGGDLTWYVRRADGSVALATKGAEYEVVDLPSGVSKETTYLKNNSGYAYRIAVAKAGVVRFDYTWTLPCGHNYFAVSIVNSKGEEVAADSVYYSYVQKDCTLSRTVNLEPGEYRIEVTYRAGHQGKEGSFTARYTADAPYSDVPEGSWYHDAVLEVSTMGLMTGYGDGTFGPSDPLTRAQAATILWRYFQPTASKNYNAQTATNRTKMADVESGCFYTEAANWAVEIGVIHGVEKDGELCFDPNASIPREQLCVMVANAAHELCGRSIEGASRAKLDAMPDAQSVPEWAADSIAWCLNEGVVNGVNENGTRYVEPAAIVDRATMAQIMVNAIDGGALSR